MEACGSCRSSCVSGLRQGPSPGGSYGASGSLLGVVERHYGSPGLAGILGTASTERLLQGDTSAGTRGNSLKVCACFITSSLTSVLFLMFIRGGVQHVNRLYVVHCVFMREHYRYCVKVS